MLLLPTAANQGIDAIHKVGHRNLQAKRAARAHHFHSGRVDSEQQHHHVGSGRSSQRGSEPVVAHARHVRAPQLHNSVAPNVGDGQRRKRRLHATVVVVLGADLAQVVAWSEKTKKKNKARVVASPTAALWRLLRGLRFLWQSK